MFEFWVDLLVFTIALAGVCLLVAASTCVSVVTARRPSTLALATLLTTLLFVLGCSGFYGHALVTMFRT